MTPQEFKAWFDGFTEAFDGAPSEAQWGRIKARVSEIDGKPVTERIYVDRYLSSVPAYVYPSYPYRPYWSGMGVGQTTSGLASGAVLCNATSNAMVSGFESTAAMNSLGRLEAQGVA